MKNQLKKSLSLIMAVLMVLSCWVWIAPTEAEAATAGSYTVKVGFNVDNGVSDGESDAKIIIDYITNNGTGKKDTMEYNIRALSTSTGDKVTPEFEVPGFPVSVTMAVKGRKGVLGINADVVTIATKTITIEGEMVWNDQLTAKHPGAGGDITQFFTDIDKQWFYSTAATYNDGLPNTKWSLPYPEEISGLSDSATDVPEITIPDMGSEKTVTPLDGNGNAIVFTGKVYDQYGVAWYMAPEYNLSKIPNSTTDISSDGVFYINSSTLDPDGVTLHATADMQKGFPMDYTSENDYIDYYIVAYSKHLYYAAYASQRIRVYYPKYNWQFYGNGVSVSNIPASIMMSDGTAWNKGSDFIANDYQFYGQSIENYYPVEAVKEGFTFKGFWTKMQPSLFPWEATPSAFEDNFLEPMDSKTYEQLEEAGMNPGEKYYPAGTKWDPVNNPSQFVTEDNNTYHAWWLADDVSVKFYDADGSFIRENVLKAGDTHVTLKNRYGLPEPTATSYQSGPIMYSNWNGKWVNTDGEIINLNTGYVFKHNLVLTPQYDTVSATYKYLVTFFDTGSSFGATEYTYRGVAVPPSSDKINLPDATDAVSYEFAGWTTQAPETTGINYHSVRTIEDGIGYTVDGKAVYLVEDFIVRGTTTYYPVLKEIVKEYNITFIYRNAQGVLTSKVVPVGFGEEIVAPAEVPASFANGGYGRELLGWKKNGAGNVISDLSTEACAGNATYVAEYSALTPSEYTITFEYKEDDAENAIARGTVSHGDKIPYKLIADIAVPEYYEENSKRYVFEDTWDNVATAEKEGYTVDKIAEIEPQSNMTFKANYGEGIDIFTVTYVNDGVENALSAIAGGSYPAVDAPTKVDPENKGSYTFVGWYDAEEGGNLVDVETATVTRNITLYARYDYALNVYEVKFLDKYGEELIPAASVEHGSSLATLAAQAEAAARAQTVQDTWYTYTFENWDIKVPAECTGNITFTAEYRTNYRYYDVEWYNSEAEMKSSATPLTISKYIYEDKIHVPSVAFRYPEAPTGKYSAFAGWFYLDDEGNAQPYVRGMKVTKNMKMFATYSEEDTVYTVTVVLDEATNNKYTLNVKHGGLLNIDNPIGGYIDADTHNAFAKWVTRTTNEADEVVESDFVLTTPITADTTIYAKYTVAKHATLVEVKDFGDEEAAYKAYMEEFYGEAISTAPSYPVPAFTDFGNVPVEAETGNAIISYWCECNRELTAKTKEGLPLTDKVDPTASTYIGTRKWEDEAKAEASEAVHANKNTAIIITTGDMGGCGNCGDCGSCELNAEYNSENKGIGVNKIYSYTVKADETTVVEDVTAWTTIYDWDAYKPQLITYYQGWENVPEIYKEYNANVADKVGNLKTADGAALVDGTEYVTYYKIVDKADNASFMRTGKFIYDETVPTVVVSGHSNKAKTVYCDEATLVITEKNLSDVTVKYADGTVASIYDELVPASQTVEGADGTMTMVPIENAWAYLIEANGEYEITATDISGNKTTAKFSVADHDVTVYTVAPTCTEPGYESNKCVVCGIETKQTAQKPATGHKTELVTVDSTCYEDGYSVNVCTVCGEEVGDRTVIPKKTHKYGEEVIVKESNCSIDGLKKKTCEYCGDVVETVISHTETPDAHDYYRPLELIPTCTEPGYKTRTCRYCKDVEVLGHGYTAEEAEGTIFEGIEATDAYKAQDHQQATDKDGNVLYKVISNPTCKGNGSKTAYCSVCRTAMGEPVVIENKINGVVMGHTWAVQEDTAEETVYVCIIDGCGATHTVKKEAGSTEELEPVNIEFFDEKGVAIKVKNGETEEAVVITKKPGESVPADAVTAPAKQSTNENDYEFDGWYTATVAEDGTITYGTKYDLPFTVSGALKLYAKYTPVERMYTITFKVPTTYTEVPVEGEADKTEMKFGDYVEVKRLYGPYNSKRMTTIIPEFEEDTVNTYTFDGWKKAGVKFDGIVKADETYEADFKVNAKTYGVFFKNEGSYITRKDKVIGDTVVYDGKEPTKAFDETNHYAFAGWVVEGTETPVYTSTTLPTVTGEVTYVAKYTATAHTLETEGTVTQNATCTLPVITEYDCTDEACEYVYVVTGEALGHEEETKYDEETGKNVTVCTRCDEVISSVDASFTVRFENWDGSRILTKDIKAGATFFDEAKTAEDRAERKADEQNTYTFKAWIVKGDATTEYASDKLPAAQANVTYVATYTPTARKYKVFFATENNQIVKTFEVVYNASIDYTYDQFVKDAAAKGIDAELPKSDSNGHYSCSGWDKDITAITEDEFYVRPVYVQNEHDYGDPVPSDATCTENGGYKKTCETCGYSYTYGDILPTGHDYQLSDTVLPDYAAGTDGKRVYTCTKCGASYEVVIPGSMVQITVNVKDQSGNPISNALVRLYVKDVNGEFVESGYADRTKADGTAIFMVIPGEYRVYISADGLDDTWYDVSVDENGNTTGNKDEVIVQKPVEDTSCKCSCHRNNFWGSFFRFFQKIIKLFTGKASCCADPDSRI